jgi:hypothetical protein
MVCEDSGIDAKMIDTLSEHEPGLSIITISRTNAGLMASRAV